jgi:hypothetical protein
MAHPPALANAQLARPTLASRDREVRPGTKRYRPPLNLRLPRRFSTTRRGARERWIA